MPIWQFPNRMKRYQVLLQVVIAAMVVACVVGGMKHIVTSPSPTGYLLVTIGKGADEAPTVTALFNKAKPPSEEATTVITFRTFEEQVARLEVHLPIVRTVLVHVTGPLLGKPEIRAARLVDWQGNVLWSTAEGSDSLKIPHPIHMPVRSEWLWAPWQAYLAAGLALLVVAALLWSPLVALLTWRPSAVPFIATMAGGTLAAACVYYLAIEMQREAPLPSEYWVPDTMMEKVALIRKAAPPRTILTGGSAGLYGIDAALMSRESGQACFNMAVHAAMPLEYYLDHLREVWAKGDTVVLHLEFHYWQDNGMSGWMLDQALSWGSRGVSQKWLQISPLDEVLHLAPDRVLGGLIAKSFPAAYGRVPLRISTPWGGEDWQYGSIRQVLDDHGDRVFTNQPLPLPELSRYMVNPRFDEKTMAVQHLGVFLADAHAKGVPVYFGFPATMQSEYTDFHTPPFRKWVDDCIRWIDAHGAKALGRPEDMVLPRELYYGTNYHLNAEGREIHSRQLLTLLKQAGWPAH